MASQTKAEKAKARRKDYVKKRNINRNKPKGKRISLIAGDGILPKSRKFTKPKKTTASVQ
jgi:hypothetical protein